MLVIFRSPTAATGGLDADPVTAAQRPGALAGQLYLGPVGPAQSVAAHRSWVPAAPPVRVATRMA